MNDAIALLRAIGLLAPIDEHFARSVARRAGETDPNVVLAAAWVSAQTRQGHVCVCLDRYAGSLATNAEGDVTTGVRWPSLTLWRDALRRSPLVSDGQDPTRPTPLVFDASDRLYLRRYWDYERRLAAALHQRLATDDEIPDEARLEEGLRRLFPAVPPATPDAQRDACEAAVRRRFLVVSGGPGTGKTSIVVRLLVLLLEQALASRRPPPTIRLLAPTGKAAARLIASVGHALTDLPCEPTVRAILQTLTASTIHRALGPPARFARSDTPFRHHAGRPLPADVVLVDEASMVDLALMTHLLEAVPAPAKFLLLGDREQLASVDAGAVFGDICRAESRGHVTTLPRSYRYGERSGIGVLAQAIKNGDAASAWDILHRGDFEDVALRDPSVPGERSGDFATSIHAGYASYLAASDVRAAFLAFEHFRVLCAHRRGPHGVDAVNEMMNGMTRASVASVASSSHRPLMPDEAYPRRPILITANDEASGLFNGDIGLLWPDESDPALLRPVFFQPDGMPRPLVLARLPPHATAFALTIHQSQGSEFDEVAIVLPTVPSPVLTRELLYTAVTRAKRRVVLYATADVLSAAMARRINRESGLQAALALPSKTL